MRRTAMHVLVCLLLGIATNSHATDVSGAIGTTTWIAANSPYFVTDTIEVAAGDTLTIESGVDVLFGADVPMLVYGGLVAEGTESDSIRFLPDTDAGTTEWSGLRFLWDSTVPGSESVPISLRFVRISGGYADGADSTGNGGAVFAANRTVPISRSVLSGNQALHLGGAVYIHHWTKTNTLPWFIPPKGTVDLDSCVIRDNMAASGGAIAVEGWGNGISVRTNRTLIEGNNASVSGAAVYLQHYGTYICDFTTIAANGDSSISSIYLNSVSLDEINVHNSIIWNPGPVVFNGSPASRWQSDYQLAMFSVAPNLVQAPWGPYVLGSFWADPRFIDPENGDFRLQPHSPAIDAGDPDSPLDPDGTRADIGCFNRPGGRAESGLIEIAGILMTDTWESGSGPYHLVAPVAVGGLVISGNFNYTSEVLTIQPGVEVYAAENAIIRNEYSRIQASNALFAPLDPGGAWIGIISHILSIDHCTIVGAETVYGWYLEPDDPLACKITNSIVVADSVVNGIGVTYSDIVRDSGVYPGEGNINAEPGFVDVSTGDYRLQAGSPCVDTADPASSPDPDGSRADMGAYPYEAPFPSEPLSLPELYAGSGENVTVPTKVSFADVISADMAFLFNSEILIPAEPFIVSHAFDGYPASSATSSIIGDTVRVSLTWDGSSSAWLNDEPVVELAFVIAPGLIPGTRSMLSWLEFPATSLNETVTEYVDGFVEIDDLWGDVTDDGSLSAMDASWILQNVVHIRPMIDNLLADVSGNGFVTGYDAALVLWKILYPVTQFPVEGGTPRIADETEEQLFWTHQGDTWVLTLENPGGALGVELQFRLPDDAVLSSTNFIAISRNDDLVTVSLASASSAIDLLRIDGVTSVPEIVSAWINERPAILIRPMKFALEQNAPNPFNPSTTIRFVLPEAGRVRLIVYDVTGRVVRTLANVQRNAGAHAVVWNGRDDVGRAAASGVYVYRLTWTGAESHGSAVRRGTLVR
jgi:hypothetical protein